MPAVFPPPKISALPASFFVATDKPTMKRPATTAKNTEKKRSVNQLPLNQSINTCYNKST